MKELRELTPDGAHGVLKHEVAIAAESEAIHMNVWMEALESASCFPPPWHTRDGRNH